MPVTKEQAALLASLAAACRPHGARHWESAGTVAAIGKVKHLALADVAFAVLRAAADRNVETPGVIANTKSPCWSERIAEPSTRRVDWPDDHARCRTCSLGRGDHERLWADDHPFEPATDHKRDPDSIARINASLREALREPVVHHPSHEPTTEGTEHVAPIRAALAAAKADTEEQADA